MGKAFAPIYFFLLKKPDGANGKELGIANLAILGVLPSKNPGMGV